MTLFSYNDTIMPHRAFRARNYWVSGCPGHTKMVTETQFLEQELSGSWTTLNFGFLTGNQEIAKEIQILRQVFQMKNQILIIISSPDSLLTILHLCEGWLGVGCGRVHHYSSVVRIICSRR